jgi:aminoglycoside phosphotransferase (APT) family kinase protein
VLYDKLVELASLAQLRQNLFNSDYGEATGLGDNSLAMGIPPAPTTEQFEQVARVIDPAAQVVSTRKLSGGISCRMDVVEVQLANGTITPVITRQYWEFEDPAKDDRLFGESAVLDALTAHNMLAPKVVVSKQDASKIFGRHAIVISYLDGVPNLTPEDPCDWANQLASSIAKVHSTPISPAVRSVLEPAHASIAKWMEAQEPSERFAKHSLGPQLWSAMRKMWPTVDTSGEYLVHGDYWPGNTVWNGETLLAIVDWEGPALGEPMLDIGYFLSDAAYFGIDVETTFLETYERASGNPIKDLLFWKMAAAARAMPDVGPWTQGYAELGIRTMTAGDIRKAHADFVRDLLNQFG